MLCLPSLSADCVILHSKQNPSYFLKDKKTLYFTGELLSQTQLSAVRSELLYLTKTDWVLLSSFLQAQKSWIERAFSKRECVHIIVSGKDPHRWVRMYVTSVCIHVNDIILNSSQSFLFWIVEEARNKGFSCMIIWYKSYKALMSESANVIAHLTYSRLRALCHDWPFKTCLRVISRWPLFASQVDVLH